MLINRIENCTRTLGKPEDWDNRYGSCSSLPIRDETQGGLPVMISSWQPTLEEINLLLKGAPVLLKVVGIAHPPVMLSVGEIPSWTL